MKIEATKGKKLIENHKEFLSRKEQRFYADIVTPLLDKAKCEYDALIENFL